jgi:hypothetical protein
MPHGFGMGGPLVPPGFEVTQAGPPDSPIAVALANHHRPVASRTGGFFWCRGCGMVVTLTRAHEPCSNRKVSNEQQRTADDPSRDPV